MIEILPSNVYELKQIDQNNKGLFSKVDIKPWTSVLEADPICTSVAAILRNRFCSYCLL